MAEGSASASPGNPSDNDNPHIPAAIKAELQALLNEYSDVFEPLTSTPPERPVGHTIPLVPDSRPPVTPMSRLSKPEQEELKKQIKDYLAKGMIEPSSSPYAAPILFVQKKSGELCMCIDYRQLNKLTLRDLYPLPRIDDLFDRLSGCSVFSSLDLQAGYHQIRITPEDVPKTAFRTPEGHFQFKVLSFGLTNAPATFQRVMNDAFAPVLGKCALVYLDDILVMSKSLPDHMQHLRLVFDLLRANKLFAKMYKCEFMQLTLKFLGHVITAGAISVDPDKAAYANKARRDVEYKVGQKVLLSTKNLKLRPGKARKLIPRYVGPFEILLLVGAVAVKLDLPASMSRLHPVFHVSLIKPYTGTDVGFMPPPVTWMDKTPVYYVERLLDHKGVKDNKASFYLAEVQRLRDVEQSLMGTVDGLQGDLGDLEAAHQSLQGEHTALQQVACRAAATNHSLRAARHRLQGQVHIYRNKHRPHRSPLTFKQRQQLLVLEQHPVSVEVLRRCAEAGYGRLDSHGRPMGSMAEQLSPAPSPTDIFIPTQESPVGRPAARTAPYNAHHCLSTVRLHLETGVSRRALSKCRQFFVSEQCVLPNPHRPGKTSTVGREFHIVSTYMRRKTLDQLLRAKAIHLQFDGCTCDRHGKVLVLRVTAAVTPQHLPEGWEQRPGAGAGARAGAGAWARDGAGAGAAAGAGAGAAAGTAAGAVAGAAAGAAAGAGAGAGDGAAAGAEAAAGAGRLTTQVTDVLAIIPLPIGTAEAHVQVIMQELLLHGLDSACIASITADSASVNMGEYGGVVTRMSKLLQSKGQPGCIRAQPCYSHGIHNTLLAGLAALGSDYGHTTVEEAMKMTGKQLQSYLQYHKQEVHTSWRVPKLLSHVCTHIRGKLPAAAPPQQQLTPAGTTPELAEPAGAPPQQQQQLAAASTSRKRGAPAANKSRAAKQGATHNSVAKRACAARLACGEIA
ncbi:hypothetical protein QJQ45_010678 [Haematococcus lacustris]|nr:hypothetical protein QJQ45_010678 [Haematococcus lacustris]